MEVVRTKEALRQAIRSLRRNGKTVGLVPTMGALHAGHVSLVDIARRHADAVAVSIFVNPTQFGPNEDFSQYPRTETDDLRKLEAGGVEVAYLPSVEEMYPAGASTKVSVGPIAEELCGAFRPGHFDGVATIVCKLFMQAAPDVAVFGEKDYQQLHVIRSLVRDLDIPVTIIGAPIMREADGLAMSSRNRYLSQQQRAIAASLYRVLSQTAQALEQGQECAEALSKAKKDLLASGFTTIDYIELRDAGTLAPRDETPSRLREGGGGKFLLFGGEESPPNPLASRGRREELLRVPSSLSLLPSPPSSPRKRGEGTTVTRSRLLAAAWLGTTRLIDNIEV